MLDLDRGWVKYADGMVQTTDGGAHWQEASGTEVPPVDGGADAVNGETIAMLLSLEAGTGSTAGSAGVAGAVGSGGTSGVVGTARSSPSASTGDAAVGAAVQGSLAFRYVERDLVCCEAVTIRDTQDWLGAIIPYDG